MSDGHRTTCIQRPRDATRASSSRPRDDNADESPDASRFAEFTRPIAKDKRLVKGRGKRLVFALVAVVIAAALIASLFVLPVKSWMQQRDDLARKQNQLAVLHNANARLAADVSRLNTPDGIKEAARQEVGMVGFGEQRISVLTTSSAPLTLPPGWPYDAIAQIVAVRAASVAVAAAPVPEVVVPVVVPPVVAPVVDPAAPSTTVTAAAPAPAP